MRYAVSVLFTNAMQCVCVTWMRRRCVIHCVARPVGPLASKTEQHMDNQSNCPGRKETGSQVLGSWNKQVRADNSFYRVREAVVAA